MAKIYDEFQQGSEAWIKIRCGLPSASNFSRLVTSKGEPSTSLAGYAGELAAELFAGKTLDQFDNVWMERGREKEAEARELFSFTHDVEVQQVGFITTDDGRAGCSPDGLIGDDMGLEIKCLKSDAHVAALHYWQKHSKCPTAYVQQVQGSLWVTGRKEWRLMFYHPDMPPLVIPIKPDLAMHRAIAAGVAAVIAERDAQLASLKHQQQHIPT